MLETLRSELGLARGAITRTFLVALLVSGTAFVVLFNIAVLKDGVDSVVDAVVKVGVAFGFAVTYAVTLALVVAAIALGWHLFGAFLALPFVLTPLLLLLVFWLGGGLVLSFAGDLLQALEASAKAALDSGAFDGLRVAHAGGPAALIILLVILPWIIITALPVLLGPPVLLALLKLLAGLGFLVVVAIGLALLVSLPALAWALVHRVRARQRT